MVWLPVTKVVGAAARTSSISTSAIVIMSMPAAAQAAASSPFCAETWVILMPAALLDCRSATVRFRTAGLPP